MRRLKTVAQRWLAIFKKKRLDADLDEEISFHLEMEAQRLVKDGSDPKEAYLAARRSFGGVEQVKEAYRDRRGLPGVESFGRDEAYAVRTLRRHPGYAAAAMLSLALGIGANTAVFSLLDAFVLQPLPYPDAGRLVHIYAADRHGGRFSYGAVSAPVLRDWRERAHAFTAIGAFTQGSANLADAEGAVRVAATLVEPEVFHALGVPALQGRGFLKEHTGPGMDRVVVLSHSLWQDRFGGRADVIGQTLRIDSADRVVVGVMPAGFEFPPRASAALWVPLTFTSMEEVISRSTRSTRFLAVLLASFSGLAVVLAIVGVYGVMSYIVAQRHREIGVRMAMGASRGEVLRFVLTRGARRTLVGVIVGMLSAVSLSQVMRPFLIGVGPVDVVSHLGAALTILVVALAACAIPGLRAARVDPVEALRHE